MEIKKWVLTQINKLNFNDCFIVDAVTGIKNTYEELFLYSLSIGEKIGRDPSIKKVITVLDNSRELLALYFCGMLYDLTIITIDTKKKESEIADLINQNIENSIVIRSQNDAILEDSNVRTGRCENIKKQVLNKIEERDFRGEYLISFTSGTSGNAKGVCHSLADMFQTIQAFDQVHPIKEKHVFGHVFPMSYMAGILNSILVPFIFGNTIVILGRFDIKKAISFWSILERYGINSLWLSPTMLNMILKINKKAAETYHIDKDIQIFVGTAPLTLQMKEAFEKVYNVKLYVSYGLTELLFLSVDTDKSHDKKDGNVGEILPGVELKKGCSEGLVKTKWQFSKYTNENDSEYFDGDYYKTGDIVEIIDGTLYITGRKKELIIKGGMNISPVRIENEVLKIPEVLDAAVWGESAKEEEEIFCAYVMAENSGANDVEKKINQKILKDLGNIYRIDKFYKVDQLIYNNNGKKDLKRIKEKVLDVN